MAASPGSGAPALRWNYVSKQKICWPARGHTPTVPILSMSPWALTAVLPPYHLCTYKVMKKNGASVKASNGRRHAWRGGGGRGTRGKVERSRDREIERVRD